MANPRIGDMRGSINCAPMVTTERLAIKPKVAMVHENMIIIKKSVSGAVASIKSFEITAFLVLEIFLLEYTLFKIL